MKALEGIRTALFVAGAVFMTGTGLCLWLALVNITDPMKAVIWTNWGLTLFIAAAPTTLGGLALDAVLREAYGRQND